MLIDLSRLRLYTSVLTMMKCDEAHREMRPKEPLVHSYWESTDPSKWKVYMRRRKKGTIEGAELAGVVWSMS